MQKSRWAQMGLPQWVEFHKFQQRVRWLPVNAALPLKQEHRLRAVDAATYPC